MRCVGRLCAHRGLADYECGVTGVSVRRGHWMRTSFRSRIQLRPARARSLAWVRAAVELTLPDATTVAGELEYEVEQRSNHCDGRSVVIDGSAVT
jgi:hypothetical protein